jgi:hypothetical protein
MNGEPRYDNAGFRIYEGGVGVGPIAADLVQEKMAANAQAAEQGLPPVYPNVPGATGRLALAAPAAVVEVPVV